jgi:hypothetical protein
MPRGLSVRLAQSNGGADRYRHLGRQGSSYPLYFTREFEIELLGLIVRKPSPFGESRLGYSGMYARPTARSQSPSGPRQESPRARAGLLLGQVRTTGCLVSQVEAQLLRPSVRGTAHTYIHPSATVAGASSSRASRFVAQG